MLFKVDNLKRIKKGEVTIAFRKWKRPTIKVNGTLITRVGQLKILKIEDALLSAISDEEIKKAGIDNKDEFIKFINKKEGQLHKITFVLVGPDPRLALRNKTDFSTEEINTLMKKLENMDRRGKYGPWTERVLQYILKNPKKRAIEIAKELNVEKDWLKPNIRKLKALGLTISHEVGYELSPRGKSFLNEIF